MHISLETYFHPGRWSCAHKADQRKYNETGKNTSLWDYNRKPCAVMASGQLNENPAFVLGPEASEEDCLLILLN